MSDSAELKLQISEDDLSLRDHFAGLAMQAIIGKDEMILAKEDDRDTIVKILEPTALGAYAYADAMMLARKGKPVDVSFIAVKE
jgi:hypothetical protein